MEGLGFDALMVVLALFLVALNGLFVAAEFGLVKIRSTQVDGLVREGRRSSGLLKKATEKLDSYLSVARYHGVPTVGAVVTEFQPKLSATPVPEAGREVTTCRC